MQINCKIINHNLIRNMKTKNVEPGLLKRDGTKKKAKNFLAKQKRKYLSNVYPEAWLTYL